jgi:hypothetical protein
VYGSSWGLGFVEGLHRWFDGHVPHFLMSIEFIYAKFE